MALVMLGRSICPLCHSVLDKCDDVVATPAFLRSSHRLALYSDAAFHQTCFEQSGDRRDVETLLARFRDKMANAPNTLEAYESWLSTSMTEFE